MKIQYEDVYSPLDTLLDLEIGLWELEFELPMPDWYWMSSVYKNEHRYKIRLVKNRIIKVKKEIMNEVQYYE